MPSSNIVDDLVTQQAEFINNVQSKVYDYVRQQRRRDMIRIVEKDGIGPGQHRTHCPGLDSYLIVLGCFCTKTTYEKHQLDSVLTDPVIDIICNCYSELLQRNSEVLNAHLTQKILANDIVLQETLKIVMGELGAKGLQLAEARLAKLMHEAMSQAVQQMTHSKVGMVIGKGVGVAASSTAGHFLAQMLLKAITHHVATITAHIMGNTVAAAAIKVAAKKVCLVTITGVVVKILATKFGITSAASALHIIGWTAVGVYLAVKLNGLPEEMAEKISKGVGDTLNNSYRPSLEQVVDNLTKSASDPEKIASLITSQTMDLGRFQRELERGIDLSNKDLPELEIDVKKGVTTSWNWFFKRH